MRRTASLYTTGGDVDEALDYLSTISRFLRSENRLTAAQHILSLATHLAQVEQRHIIGKKLESAYNDLMQSSDDKKEKKLTKIPQVRRDKEIGRLEQVTRNNDDIPVKTVKMTTEDDIGNMKSLTKALDSTIIPLSAVGIYSGAGGYAAYRPGLVGLTPSQFREIRKFDSDRGQEEQEFTTSDV